jgi:hypothetical protein
MYQDKNYKYSPLEKAIGPHASHCLAEVDVPHGMFQLPGSQQVQNFNQKPAKPLSPAPRMTRISI